MNLKDIVESLGDDETLMGRRNTVYVVSRKAYAQSKIVVRRVYVLNLEKFEWELRVGIESDTKTSKTSLARDEIPHENNCVIHKKLAK